eukprot:m.180302 g.180302  ORF g.180302 m.180302 type:complete len:350 (+) comp24552_c0_seq3:249-1298(+)
MACRVPSLLPPSSSSNPHLLLPPPTHILSAAVWLRGAYLFLARRTVVLCCDVMRWCAGAEHVGTRVECDGLSRPCSTRCTGSSFLSLHWIHHGGRAASSRSTMSATSLLLLAVASMRSESAPPTSSRSSSSRPSHSALPLPMTTTLGPSGTFMHPAARLLPPCLTFCAPRSTAVPLTETTVLPQTKSRRAMAWSSRCRTPLRTPPLAWNSGLQRMLQTRCPRQRATVVAVDLPHRHKAPPAILSTPPLDRACPCQKSGGRRHHHNHLALDTMPRLNAVRRCRRRRSKRWGRSRSSRFSTTHTRVIRPRHQSTRGWSTDCGPMPTLRRCRQRTWLGRTGCSTSISSSTRQ